MTSVNAVQVLIETVTAEPADSSSHGDMAAFKEKVMSSLANTGVCRQSEAPSIADSSIIPAWVPRDANGRIFRPGGRMILTPPHTQDSQILMARRAAVFNV